MPTKIPAVCLRSKGTTAVSVSSKNLLENTVSASSQLPLRALAFLVPLAVLTGCVSDQLGPPRPTPITIAGDVALITPLAEPDINYFATSSPINQAAIRNQVITARMYIADLEYSEYEARLTKEMQTEGFLATAAVLGLTGAGSLITAAETTRILSGVAAGVTGLDKAFNDKILLSNTVQALQTQMRADRKAQAAAIYAKMLQGSGAVKIPTPIGQYTLPMALSDCERYYQAGTIASALIGLSKTVANAENNADTAKDQAGPNASQVANTKAIAVPTSTPVAPTIIRTLTAPLPSQQRVVITASDRQNPFEQSLTVPEIEQVQSGLCVAPDGKLGQSTRQAISQYLVARGLPGATQITEANERYIFAAADKVKDLGGCAKAGFHTATDVGKSFSK